MNKSIWFFFIVLTACTATRTTNYPEAVEYTLLLPAIKLVETDPIGNLYVVDEQDRLYKIDTTGARRYQITNNNLGSLHSVDAGNPFKIMLFYRDQQTIQLVDNTLSEIQRIRLSDWQLKDVTAAALSPDNAIWLYDGARKQLIKLAENGQSILSSDPLNFILPIAIRPDYIYDAGTFLVIREEGVTPFLFDDFGKYIHSLDFIPNDMIVHQNAVLYFDGALKSYDISSGRYLPHTYFSSKPGNGIFLSRGGYYSFDRKGIYLLPVKS